MQKLRTLKSLIAATVLAFSSLIVPVVAVHAAVAPTIIIVGGNGDPTGTKAEATMQQLGWIPAGSNVVLISYTADVTHTDATIADGVPKLVAAYNQYCGGINTCEIHGVSLGTDVVAVAENQLHLPNANTRVVLHNSPVPDTGIYHDLAASYFAPYIADAGFFPSVIPTATPGTEHWYNQDDPYANSAPQCYNLVADASLVTLYLTEGTHNITPSSGATFVWTGPDGVINHEFDTMHNPLSVSGSAWFKPTCPPLWFK